MLRIVVVETVPLLQRGLISVIGGEADMVVVGVGVGGNDAIALVREVAPDLIIFGSDLLRTCLGLVEQIGGCRPRPHSLVVADSHDRELVRCSMLAGISGFCLKSATPSEVVRAIHIICAGERYVAPTLAAQLFCEVTPETSTKGDSVFAGLSKRDEQILALIVEGLSNKEIGSRLAISEKTVKHYLTILLQKLNVRTRVQAAVLACAEQRDLQRRAAALMASRNPRFGLKAPSTSNGTHAQGHRAEEVMSVSGAVA